MIVHLVRHGQSYNTHRDSDAPYPANPPLTPIGVRQAALVAQRLARVEPQRLISSPMLRSVETASHVAQATGLRTEVVVSCYEHRAQSGYLCWGAREVLARYPDLTTPPDFSVDDWPYGEEPIESAIARADTFVGWLRSQAERGDCEMMVVVTHGAITRLIVARALNLNGLALAALKVDHTSLCSLQLGGDVIGVLGLNDAGHLAADPEVDPQRGTSR